MSLIPGLGKIHVETHLDPENLVFHTKTMMGKKVVYEHEFDMSEVFEIFKEKVLEEIEFIE